jgi:hypothetical protein
MMPGSLAEGIWSQPFVNAGDVHGGLATDDGLVVASRNRSVALEPVDRALNGMARLAREE